MCVASEKSYKPQKGCLYSGLKKYINIALYEIGRNEVLKYESKNLRQGLMFELNLAKLLHFSKILVVPIK